MLNMLTDYHCHILPGMDDGAFNAEVSLQMLQALRAQGVKRIAATPHFYLHRETPEEFMARREQALDTLRGAGGDAAILLGAEASLEQGLSETESISMLTTGESRHILLELPWFPLKSWMIIEVQNIAYRFGLIPVLAHLDRYLQMYGNDGMREVLSIPDAVVQINNEALGRRSTRNFALELIKGGYPVVFGSDSHDMDRRPPDFDRALKILRSKLGKAEFRELMEFNENMV